jgi:hypothetical protein
MLFNFRFDQQSTPTMHEMSQGWGGGNLNMVLRLPKGCKVGSVVEVAWDIAGTEQRSGDIVYEGYFDARGDLGALQK